KPAERTRSRRARERAKRTSASAMREADAEPTTRRGEPAATGRVRPGDVPLLGAEGPANVDVTKTRSGRNAAAGEAKRSPPRTRDASAAGDDALRGRRESGARKAGSTTTSCRRDDAPAEGQRPQAGPTTAKQTEARAKPQRG